MRNLHKHLFESKSAFARATIGALVIGAASVINTATDIIWLLGDMSVHANTYHYFVLIGLVVALGIMVLSFIWIYQGIEKFLKTKNKRTRERHEHLRKKLQAFHVHTPSHCDVKDKKVNHLLGITEFED